MELLASGRVVSAERVRAVSTVTLAISILCIVWLFATADGTLDALGRPPGTDFSNVWTAGRMVLDGKAPFVWSWPEHFAVQRAVHGREEVDVFGWHYPPPFLLIATALATLPYVPALIAWQISTLAPLTVMIWRLLPRRETLLLTLGAPVALICLTHGHNGFLTALLLGGGLALMDRRPFLAGILFGCLIYKPQLALIIPALLLADRNWRAIAGAFLSAAILVAATLLVWGLPVWQAFFDSLPLTRAVVIEQGVTGWHKIMSPFATVRMWGGGLTMSYAVQLAATIASITAVVVLTCRKADADLRNALVCAATLLSTPYVLDYDAVVLLPALAWLWRHGRANGYLSWEKSLMLFAWFTPLVARQVGEWTLIPLGLAPPLIVAAISVRRAVHQSMTIPPFTFRVWPVTYPASLDAR
ncbi:glycosyltransferase family 87 protein [Sphingomonas daechungensis]|uniref:glycosyltransferase family 87 protein n=2 Tax=Sphingomonas daechungensis TaxID=1176646 RepID=UPI0031EB707B